MGDVGSVAPFHRCSVVGMSSRALRVGGFLWWECRREALTASEKRQWNADLRGFNGFSRILSCVHSKLTKCKSRGLLIMRI
ncbi:MAG: hypothetical protein FWG87_12510 [Defluviitaleaceae bacterium]|nr:hypothetical protein [Defluviitaleaceae bacterium]